ncbi:MAG: nanoRNase/pAp phosphatase (c-di-AMP/oligoRNAs hydrolase) [Natronomonas sp.]|jgi:nanoRNase/pAp phosphatase (c-di-AMP/oligoRNAs hydrolase)
MDTWVVLGSGAPARSLGRAMADRGGGRTVHVLTPQGGTADAAREAGASATVAAPDDRSALAAIERVGGVVVATPDPDDALVNLRAARAVYPDTVLVAYLDSNGRGDDRWAAVADAADRVVDPTEATVDYLLGRVTERGMRERQLRRVLQGIDRLAIVTHDNPDPDAIASAVALRRTAAASGCEVGVYYYGAIGHQENRALVNLLEFDLTSLEPGVEPGADGIALVDHSRPGVNDGLPETTDVDIVIDHHPPRGPVEGRFVDLRSEAGATSTLLVDYLNHFGMTPATDLATGLLFGIRTDTREFRRGVSAMDFEAAAWLLPEADLGTLERVGSPSIGPETFAVIAAAVRNRREEGDVLLSCVGQLTDRDALAQAADRLIDMEGVATTVVYGVISGTIHISARSRDAAFDLGEVLREAFGRVGSAGGHADMAGAQVTLGVLDAAEDRESLVAVVETFVTSRFLDAVETAAGPPTPNTVPAADLVDRYLLWEGDGGSVSDGGQERADTDEPVDADRDEPGDDESASDGRD